MPEFSQDFLTTFMAKSCTVYITFIELNTNNYTYTGFFNSLNYTLTTTTKRNKRPTL